VESARGEITTFGTRDGLTPSAKLHNPVVTFAAIARDLEDDAAPAGQTPQSADQLVAGHAAMLGTLLYPIKRD